MTKDDKKAFEAIGERELLKKKYGELFPDEDKQIVGALSNVFGLFASVKHLGKAVKDKKRIRIVYDPNVDGGGEVIFID